ncbi:MAG TPA: hypothetical protein VLU46_11840 [Thermoanaerobaculia bacterium]|nr:hypothetical protein [Thermoanaerobaculia bacterium]
MKQFLAICLVAFAVPAFAASKSTKSPSSKTGVYNDATRLAALLQDAQATSNVDASVWKVVANEANSLANRLYGATGGNSTARKAATSARTHVRQFRDAAMSGDAAGARTHASEAMQYVTQLIDWSMPAKS